MAPHHTFFTVFGAVAFGRHIGLSAHRLSPHTPPPHLRLVPFIRAWLANFEPSCAAPCAFPPPTSSKWVGLVDTGAAEEGWEVLALDDKLLVALESQPGAKGRANGTEGGSGTRKFTIDKYRLLVRS